MTRSDFYESIIGLCLLCDGRVTSSTRSAWMNREVGGVWDSLHQIGLAADIVLHDPTEEIHVTPTQKQPGAPSTVETVTKDRLFRRMASRMSLTVIDEGDHYHVQPKGM